MLPWAFCVLFCTGADGRPPGSAALQVARHQVLDLRAEHGQEAAEVLGVPGAGEVGLAEADQLVAPIRAKNSSGRCTTATGPPRPRVSSPITTLTSRRPTAAAEEPTRDPRGDGGPRAGGQLVESGPVVGRDPVGGGRHVAPPVGGWVGSGSDGEPAQPEPDAVEPDEQRRRAERRGQPGAVRPLTGPDSDALNLAPSSVTRVTAMSRRSPGTGTPARRCRRCRGTARRTSPSAPSPALLVGVDEVGVPVAVGVVHLDHRRGQVAGGVQHQNTEIGLKQ